MRVDVALPRGWSDLVGVEAGRELGPNAAVCEFDKLDEVDGVDVLIPGGHYVPGAALERMPALRLISVDGTGFWDQVDMAAATARGVAVCNVRNYAADAVAEFTIGAMIALSRRLTDAAEAVRAGGWAPDEFLGYGLRGRILGLVGFGSIGARVAELAQAFGMRVLCTTARPSLHRAPGVRFVELNELLDRCDVLSLHARLDDSTRGLIGAREFDRLRSHVLLVNTARGGLVDTSALLATLQSGRLAGAALDVTEPEPLPDGSPLRALPNVIVTPHIAAATGDARRAAVVGCLRNVAEFLDGRPASVVNPEVLDRR